MAKKAASSASKMVYYFGKKKTEGKDKSKTLLGGKGVNLAEMTRIGLPVPPGFTITTEVCRDYYEKQLEIIRPEYIVCLGAVSAQELL